MKVMSKIKDLVYQYYGLILGGIIIITFFLFLLFNGGNTYVQINDNLDSNIPLLKMFRDNNCWIDRKTQIPMLGGIDRSVLSCGYTLQHVLFWIFDTKIAYWASVFVALLLSGFGFYFLGVLLNRLSGFDYDPNLFCIGGIIYISSGLWPSAIISFSLIPWWVVLTLEIYRTKRIWLIFVYTFLMYNISSVLIGVFLIFYTFIFFLFVSFRNKKIEKCVCLALGWIVILLLFFNRDLFVWMSHSSQGTIKSLSSINGLYGVPIKTCIIDFFKNVFIMGDHSFYHSGIWVMRYIALPVIIVFFFLFNFENIKMNIDNNFLLTFDLLFFSYLWNCFVTAFDKCYRIRKLVPFLSGFSFSRFMWLSTFFIILIWIMIMNYLKNRHFIISVVVLMIALPVSIVLDPDYDQLRSQYNALHANYCHYFLNRDLFQQIKWDDFYSCELFESAKKDIDYNDEWSVSYGFEPGILQYNGIHTLDGYYSNYPTDYKIKWEKMIEPVLEKNVDALNYWYDSNGQRAYIYSDKWKLCPDYNLGYKKLGDVDMLINPDILKELGCKYVFSRVPVGNYKQLGLKNIKSYHDNVYDLYVYTWLVPEEDTSLE